MLFVVGSVVLVGGRASGAAAGARAALAARAELLAHAASCTTYIPYRTCPKPLRLFVIIFMGISQKSSIFLNVHRDFNVIRFLVYL